MANNWTKVGGGNGERHPNWKPEKVNDEATGVLVDVRENVGPNHSKLYTLQKEDGSFFTVWGSAGLDRNLSSVPLGNEVRIVYLGKAKNPNSGREFHNFEIYSRKPQEGISQVENEEESVATDDIPF